MNPCWWKPKRRSNYMESLRKARNYKRAFLPNFSPVLFLSSSVQLTHCFNVKTLSIKKECKEKSINFYHRSDKRSIKKATLRKFSSISIFQSITFFKIKITLLLWHLKNPSSCTNLGIYLSLNKLWSKTNDSRKYLWTNIKRR